MTSVSIQLWIGNYYIRRLALQEAVREIHKNSVTSEG